jgi:chromatin remodeling complex protein RSC6
MAKGGWRGKTQLQIIPDENLAKIIGSKPTLSSTMIHNLWVYIKAHCKIEKIKL